MDKTIRTFEQTMKEIRNQEWKFCSLLDVDHDVIISSNPPKKAIAPKLKEIEKRYRSLPDGIYCLICRNNYGTRFKPQNYYFGKGKYDDKQLKEPAPVVIEKKMENNNNALSFEKALENVGTIARLENENKLLCEKIKTLEIENQKLLSELDEEPETTMGDLATNIGGWLKEMTPTLIPVLDRYFDNQKQKQEFQQMKYLADKGFEIPGLKKLNGNGHTKQVNGNNALKENKVLVKEIPAPNTPDWLQFVSYVMALPENEFDNFMSKMESEKPEIFIELEKIVYEE